ncbi:ATP-binding protein [Coraliomargarita sp. SDUM461004]|uniref:histidine kinase n=1 Tax=Thalassobacterium sedimentorum TaxID=3041258 RepID=A0ABU1AHL7_9BACT|nr:ATP-binding protein [Coraliomargarita sp. SDUM461004]MDQ8194266.1 ATP-binding protein [Coraliomargarita sp. SDUM461004]
MKNPSLRFALKFLFSVLAAAFAAQITVTLTDDRFGESVRQVAPAYGVAIAIVMLGGYRYLPAVFIGTLIPAIFEKQAYLLILSMPFAVTVTSALAYRLMAILKVDYRMERIRDALLIIFVGFILSTILGAVVQTLFFLSSLAINFEGHFVPLLWTNWLSASVGAIIATPFLLTWANPSKFRLAANQGVEVCLWFVTLLLFGHITFQNWAPSDTLFYPMELAIFPIMAWSATRFGLRGASAGVLALALLAGWEIIRVLSGDGSGMSQSPANIWIFVGVVSITSICLAAVMMELRIREAQVLENETRLRAFTEALPDIAFVLTREGEIRDIFAASARIEANHRIVSAERAVGRNIADIFDSSVCRGFMDTIEKTIQVNEIRKHEYSLESADVGEHVFEARVTPMRRSAGGTSSVVWVAYDISERKLAETAIKDRDKILRATARANNNLLVTQDVGRAVEAAMREVGNALNVERAFIFEITDRTNEALQNFCIQHEWRLHENCPSFLGNPHYQDAPLEEFCPGWYQTLNEGGYMQIDSRRKDALSVDVLRHFNSRSMLVMPMWMEGELYGFFGVDHCSRSHDWSDGEIYAVRVLSTSLSGLLLIRGQEKQLRVAIESADAASSAKGEFLAMMSHEIRTPMNAIIGYTDLLGQADLSETQSEQVAIIKRSGRALLDLINNILDYSKIESRSLELDVEEFDIEQVVCESLESVLVMAQEKGIHVHYELEPNLQETYIGDAHRIRQVLTNLVNNGVKFTTRGEVSIHVKLESAEAAKNCAYDTLHFEVRDTGCGIAKDKFQLLFRAFSQVDSSTTRKYGGTGLGLIISKRLIERMQGQIWVDSELGSGSQFHFTIQLLRKEHEANTLAPFVKQTGTDDRLAGSFAEAYPLRILVCEDDKDNRRVIRELLEMLGYRPHVVESGEDALEQLKHRAYDTVLLDVRLPGLSGIELTRAIRSGAERIERCEQHIIAVTAFAMNEDRQSCLDAGMNDFIRKPVEIVELKDALRRAYHEFRA